MFFRNLTLFRFGDGVVPDAQAFDAALAEHPLRDVGPLELTSAGLISPFGRDHESATFSIEGASLFAVGQQERILPSIVIAEELAHRTGEIAVREGRRVGAKERKRIKEEIVSEFLPRAFVRPRRTLAYVDRATGWLVVDTSSRAVAEMVISQVREALGRFPVTPPTPENSPRCEMTDWLINSAVPDSFMLGDDCELRDPAEAGATVRCRRQDLETDEVREHLRSGKQAFRLGFVYDGRMSFSLTEDVSIRSLRFHDVVLDTIAEGAHETAEAEAIATFTLMLLELRRLLESIATLFQIPRAASLKLDGGDAPASMRDANRASAAAARLDKMAREDGDATLSGGAGNVLATFGGDDELYDKAVAIVIETQRASIAGVQRHLGIGYNRAARLIERMEQEGIVSAPDSRGARTLLASA